MKILLVGVDGCVATKCHGNVYRARFGDPLAGEGYRNFDLAIISAMPASGAEWIESVLRARMREPACPIVVLTAHTAADKLAARAAQLEIENDRAGATIQRLNGELTALRCGATGEWIDRNSETVRELADEAKRANHATTGKSVLDIIAKATKALRTIRERAAPSAPDFASGRLHTAIEGLRVRLGLAAVPMLEVVDEATRRVCESARMSDHVLVSHLAIHEVTEATGIRGGSASDAVREAARRVKDATNAYTNIGIALGVHPGVAPDHIVDAAIVRLNTPQTLSPRSMQVIEAAAPGSLVIVDIGRTSDREFQGIKTHLSRLRNQLGVWFLVHGGAIKGEMLTIARGKLAYLRDHLNDVMAPPGKPTDKVSLRVVPRGAPPPAPLDFTMWSEPSTTSPTGEVTVHVVNRPDHRTAKGIGQGLAWDEETDIDIIGA